jgi:hypothetical protein
VCNNVRNKIIYETNRNNIKHFLKLISADRPSLCLNKATPALITFSRHLYSKPNLLSICSPSAYLTDHPPFSKLAPLQCFTDALLSSPFFILFCLLIFPLLWPKHSIPEPLPLSFFFLSSPVFFLSF